jgi:hypothetical protein
MLLQLGGYRGRLLLLLLRQGVSVVDRLMLARTRAFQLVSVLVSADDHAVILTASPVVAVEVINNNGGPSWLVIVLAGAAGSALTLLARVTIVPAQVAAHDRRIADIDIDLDRYAADEYVRLAFNLREIRYPGGEDSQVPQREVSRACALAVVQSTQLYRDEESARIRDMREMVASEGMAHRVWRRLARRPIVALTTPDLASRVLDKWQTLVPSYGGEEKIVRLIDPRKRTIAEVAPELEASTDEPN